jgi:hypothetical protein
MLTRYHYKTKPDGLLSRRKLTNAYDLLELRPPKGGTPTMLRQRNTQAVVCELNIGRKLSVGFFVFQIV